MTQQVPTTFVTTFENNMKLKLQQTQPMLAPFAMMKQVSGEKVQLDDLVGHVQAMTADDRHGDTKYANTGHDRVWVAKPPAAYYAELVDRQDKLAAAIDLQSGYMMTAMATINRAHDDAFLGGFYGTMMSGKDGTTLVNFPTDNVVAVDVGAGAPTRMNVAKLRAARKILAANYVDLTEERYFGATAEQIDDLLQEVPVTSKDFAAAGGELRDGKLSRLLGFNIIEMELGNPLLANSSLTVDSSGYRKNPFWAKSGMCVAVWEKIFTSIDRMPTKRYSVQIYAETVVSATRTESGKVGYILNSED